MSKQKFPAGVASHNVDEFTAGGSLPGSGDGFDATIRRVRAIVFDYNGKADELGIDPCLAYQVAYEPDDGELTEEQEGYLDELEDGTAVYVREYTGGSLDHFAPANWDGESDELEIVEEIGEEGCFVANVSGNDNRTQPKGTNWAFWLQHLDDAEFDHGRETPDLRCYEGTRVHLNLVDPPKRSGLVRRPGQDEKRVNQILVVTDVTGYEDDGGAAKAGGKAKKAAGKAKGKAAKGAKGAKAKTTKAKPAAAETAEADDVESKVEEMISEAISDAGDDGVSTRKLKGLVFKSFKGKEPALKKAALGLVTDDDWLQDDDRPWAFDEDEESLVGV